MKFAKIAAHTLGGLAALSVATLALPRHISVERTALLNASPEKVLDIASSNEGFQTFNPYKTKDPELKIDLFGPVAGVGSGFHFDGKNGVGSQTVTEVTTKQIVYAIDMGPMGQPTQSITAIETKDGTKVTWRVDSDMGFNPVFRIFGMFMDDMMGPTFELGLENLAETTV
jgi:hypothetical protein